MGLLSSSFNAIVFLRVSYDPKNQKYFKYFVFLPTIALRLLNIIRFFRFPSNDASFLEATFVATICSVHQRLMDMCTIISTILHALLENKALIKMSESIEST